MLSVFLKIRGRVQGVFFRAHTQKEAVRLKLSGWVRNTEDGGVEAEAFGEKEALESFVNWCHRGPPSARVTNVEVLWGNNQKTSSGFHIRY